MNAITQIPPPPPEPPCPHCASGPRGIAGHAQLITHSLGSHIVFKCRTCRSLWSRSSRRGGDYAWTDLSGRATFGEWVGVLVPTR